MELTKRALLVVLLIYLSMLSSCSQKPEHSEFSVLWQEYKGAFYDDGRIIDTGNQGVSHSEGQGYAMLFAVAAGDKQHFEHLWQWTRQHLQRDDYLFSWRYRPCEYNDKRCVDDPNNATDGDILIAWALFRASKEWHESAYRDSAIHILKALASCCIVRLHELHYLLPAASGFMTDEDNFHINLSYWVFPAFAAFFEETDDLLWLELYLAGERLIASSQDNRFSLTPDWLKIEAGKPNLAASRSTEYGFNACRVPLHLSWPHRFNQKNRFAGRLTGWERYWQARPFPATLDLLSGTAAAYSANRGMEAVADTVLYFAHGKTFERERDLSDQDYYSASLILLSHLATLDE